MTVGCGDVWFKRGKRRSRQVQRRKSVGGFGKRVVEVASLAWLVGLGPQENSPGTRAKFPHWKGFKT